MGRMPEMRFVPGQEPRLRIDWFHRHLDHLVVEVS
jgi:hypothetical protein